MSKDTDPPITVRLTERQLITTIEALDAAVATWRGGADETRHLLYLTNARGRLRSALGSHRAGANTE